MPPLGTLPPPRLFQQGKDDHLLPQIAEIQAACILQDGQLATFLPPLDMSMIAAYWGRIARTAGHTPTPDSPSGCEIVLQMAPKGDGGEEVVAGYVVLSVGWSQTGPFRAEVLKLMVHPELRRQGIARRVMDMLEDVARDRGRGLLVSALVGLRSSNERFISRSRVLIRS